MCDVPKRSWTDALPAKRVALTAAGLAAAGVGIWSGDLLGLGVFALAVGLLVGAVVLPTVRQVEFGLPAGVKIVTAVRTREEQFSEYFASQKADLELAAHLLCEDAETAAELLESAWSSTVRDWRGPAADPGVRVYVLCVLVQLTIAHRRWVVTTPDSPRSLSPLFSLPLVDHVVVVLHDFARLPMSQIATITGWSPAEVEAGLHRGNRALKGSSSAGGTGS